MLISLICLSSCTITNYDFCPQYPVAGAKVAEEIKDIEGKHFWDWLGRINKLRQQLELCQKKEL
jgi:Zn-finger protein